jgi:uncharacterized membrane protein affecting hemolysin expression
VFEFPDWLVLSNDRHNALSILIRLISLFIGTLQIGAIWFAASNIRQQKKQINKLSEQVKLQRESVLFSSFSHFSNLYFEVMSALLDEMADEAARRSWWYRFGTYSLEKCTSA